VTRLAFAVAALLVLATAAPAAADPVAAGLAVTVAFDQPDYFAADDITVTVSVTNTGAEPATNIMLFEEGENPFNAASWGAFSSLGDGAGLAPGERVEITATASLGAALGAVPDVLTLTLLASNETLASDPATATATVTVRTTPLTGHLYRDLDGDHTFDPGEAMSGVQVTATGGVPYSTARARTDETGRFTTAAIPEGRYELTSSLPVGWQHNEDMRVQLRVGGGDVLIRAARSSSALRASITFDRGAYAVGDTMRERVTLTNTGTADLTGVTARCVEGAGPNQLSGLGWGDLVHYTAPGVTVRAGETRTFDFTDVVPAGGRLYGFVTITCWFSTAYKYDDGPVAIARAEVPGGVGSSGGHLYVDRNLNVNVEPGEGVPGVKVFLVADDGHVVGRSMTDAKGHFWFADVPANNYELRLTGPWRPLRDTTWHIGVYAGVSSDAMQVQVIPGSIQPDLDPPPTPPVSQAVPQATVRPSTLADTGVRVEELTVLGVLLLLAGSALLFVRRPKLRA
jgi:hypothetical protein